MSTQSRKQVTQAITEHADRRIAELEAALQSFTRIQDTAESGASLVSNQGQSLDGFSELAAYRSATIKARAALAKVAK